MNFAFRVTPRFFIAAAVAELVVAKNQSDTLYALTIDASLYCTGAVFFADLSHDSAASIWQHIGWRISWPYVPWSSASGIPKRPYVVRIQDESR